MADVLTPRPTHFEDFVVGTEYRLGPRRVTSEQIIAFAREFDRLPFHLDPAAAEKSIFKGLIASGLHTLSLAASIAVDELLCTSTMTGGLGISELRWTKPVRPDDELWVSLVVAEVEPFPSQLSLGRVRMRFTVANQQGAIVMTALVDYLFGRRCASMPPSDTRR